MGGATLFRTSGYVEVIAEMGGRVVVEAQERLLPLMEGVDGYPK
jgi:hypothetical protein